MLDDVLPEGADRRAEDDTTEIGAGTGAPPEDRGAGTGGAHGAGAHGAGAVLGSAPGEPGGTPTGAPPPGAPTGPTPAGTEGTVGGGPAGGQGDVTGPDADRTELLDDVLPEGRDRRPEEEESE